jgi:hypothetical protein
MSPIDSINFDELMEWVGGGLEGGGMLGHISANRA